MPETSEHGGELTPQEIIEKGERLGIEDAMLLNSHMFGPGGRVSLPTTEYLRMLDALGELTVVTELQKLARRSIR